MLSLNAQQRFIYSVVLLFYSELNNIIMILLTILGIAAYFILPLMLVIWLLERNDYKIFGWDVDIQLVIWVTAFVEFALAVQILYWVH